MKKDTMWPRVRGLLMALALVSLLYIFVCSLTFLEVAFRLLAGRSAGNVFQTDLMYNPIVGLMIGILFTVLVQSSSTCTTVIVSLVSSEVLDVKHAIPMVMGANIGTSMTSTLVSMTHITDGKQFERAFAAATVHDCFNWIAVIVLLVVETATGYLLHVTEAIVGIHANGNGTEGTKLKIPNILAMVSDPFTDLIVRIDSSVLTCWSQGLCQEDRLLKVRCDGEERCWFLFNIPELSDAVIGGILLATALLTLTACLLVVVRLLRSILQGAVADVVKNFVNADVPRAPFLTGYVAILVGAVLTFVVQSSSVFTATITPLVGIGLIDVERMYPLVLGSNIGTTSTALLAGFASGRREPLQISLCHLLFNLSGILIMYPVPQTRLPLVLCRLLGRTTARYRWFSIAYLVFMFFLLPAFVMTLSLAGTVALTVVLGLAAFTLAAVGLVNLMQDRAPGWLPGFLKTWDFLPLPLRSLEPYDKAVIACVSACCSCCCPKFVSRLKASSSSSAVELEEQRVVKLQPAAAASSHTNEALNIVDETS